jgi:lipoate-protein ligase A
MLQNADTSTRDYLILYINRPSVVIGRNQNLFEEVNLNYCSINNIDIARRISGGGTVFHDIGNLNWAIISKFSTAKVNSYAWAALPMITLLKHYGLKAYLTSRNAIEVDGLKLSGQAQFTNRRNILSHGTLLLNSDMAYLQKAIEIPEETIIQSKASKSHRSTTANLNDLLKHPIDMDQLIEDFSSLNDCEGVELSFSARETDKLMSREWLYGRSPKFSAQHFINGARFEFQVNKGIIEGVKDEKDCFLQSNPFLNQNYEKFLISLK